MTSNIKNLHLERENLDTYTKNFSDKKNIEIRSINVSEDNKKKRVTLGAVGINDSIVDIYLNKDGTTSLQWKIGKNQELGAELCAYLKNTIDPNQFNSVNLTLKGITSEDIEPIIDELSKYLSNDNEIEFHIEIKLDDNVKKCTKIVSFEHDDNIVITHFKTTKKLTIQGKTLFTYRRAICLLSELLDLNGLQSVLSCTDNESASIVRNEIAIDYLKGKLPNSFNDLPSSIRSLMIAGCCVKLASPSLPEYSMLLFPDLRALEGVLRTILADYSLYVDEQEFGFGGFFTVRRDSVTLKEEFSEIIANTDLKDSLEEAYAFYKKHRQTLFHMKDFANASRQVDTLDKAISLSNDTYATIDKIFRAKNT